MMRAHLFCAAIVLAASPLRAAEPCDIFAPAPSGEDWALSGSSANDGVLLDLTEPAPQQLLDADDVFAPTPAADSFLEVAEYQADGSASSSGLGQIQKVAFKSCGCGQDSGCGQSGGCGCDSDCRRRGPEGLYLSFSAGRSYAVGGSGGFNTFNGTTPFGVDYDDNHYLGGAIGVREPVTLFGRDLALRWEVEGLDRHDMDFVTNSFPAAPAPTIFRYIVDVDDVWSVTSNLWLDIPVTDCFGFYVGFGLGAAGHSASIRDQLPTLGYAYDVDFSYTLGAGVTYQATDRVAIDFGWRYADLGEVDAPLYAGAIVPSGNYTLDLDSNEFIVNLRIDVY